MEESDCTDYESLELENVKVVAQLKQAIRNSEKRIYFITWDDNYTFAEYLAEYSYSEMNGTKDVTLDEYFPKSNVQKVSAATYSAATSSGATYSVATYSPSTYSAVTYSAATSSSATYSAATYFPSTFSPSTYSAVTYSAPTSLAATASAASSFTTTSSALLKKLLPNHTFNTKKFSAAPFSSYVKKSLDELSYEIAPLTTLENHPFYPDLKLVILQDLSQDIIPFTFIKNSPIPANPLAVRVSELEQKFRSRCRESKVSLLKDNYDFLYNLTEIRKDYSIIKHDISLAKDVNFYYEMEFQALIDNMESKLTELTINQ